MCLARGNEEPLPSHWKHRTLRLTCWCRKMLSSSSTVFCWMCCSHGGRLRKMARRIRDESGLFSPVTCVPAPAGQTPHCALKACTSPGHLLVLLELEGEACDDAGLARGHGHGVGHGPRGGVGHVDQVVHVERRHEGRVAPHLH